MLNQVTLIGNVGSIDMRTVNGRKYANISIACNEYYKDKDGNKKENTNWFRVSILSEKLVEIVEKHVKKGDRLYVQGKLQNSEYTDKEGIKRYSTDVVLGNYDSKLIMLSAKKDTAGDDNSTPPAGCPDVDEEIPY